MDGKEDSNIPLESERVGDMATPPNKQGQTHSTLQGQKDTSHLRASETQEKAKATRKANKGKTPLDRAQDNPTNLRKAIEAKCWDCTGRGADGPWRKLVHECHITDCGLWHVRPLSRSRK